MNHGLSGILLGGGKSTRMGQPKGLLLYRGRPWLEWQLTQLATCEIDEVVVVLGPDYLEYLKQLPALKPAQEKWIDWSNLSVRLLVNQNVEAGPFASMQCGFGAWTRPLPAVFVLPLDTPCPEKSTWQILKEHMNKSRQDVAIPTYQGKGGHPVLLSSEFANHLQSVSVKATDARLDQQIKALPPAQVARLPVKDDKVLLNLNTPEEWQSFVRSTGPLPG